MRVALYARYSSDLQSDRSVDDQLAVCRRLILDQRLGEVGQTYADHAISGAHLRSRPAMLRLLADAKAGGFDVLVAEALDRLSRDQEDVAAIYKRLSFAGVRIVTLAEGPVSELHIGLKGTMNALFLKDLAAKVRRGQAGRAKNGFCPGGLSYGYKVVRSIDARGELVRGERAIDERQAEVVRWIFAGYAQGLSPRAIAARLNAEGVPSPAGRQWNASTINGWSKRGTGILHNQLYVGRMTYNRQTFAKDPESGRRLPRVLPLDDRLVVDVPHLRIVDDAAWEAVRARVQLYDGVPMQRQVRPKRLFSGLMRCACCDGPVVSVGNGRVGCSRHKERGACENRSSVTWGEVERRVLAGLKKGLLAPGVVEAFLAEYRAARARLRREQAGGRDQATARLAAVERSIGRLVDAIAETGLSPGIKARLAEFEREKIALARALAPRAADSAVDVLDGAVAARYRRMVQDLETTLDRGADRWAQAVETVETVRRLTARIVIGKGKPTAITLHGTLAHLDQPAVYGAGGSGGGIWPPPYTLAIAC